MIIVQKENYSQLSKDWESIIPVHYEELALDRDKVPLMVDHDKYFSLEENNALFIVTIRDNGKLIGYYVGFISSEMHYASTFSCMTDIFYVLPEYRKQGAGKILFSHVEKELKEIGIDRWFVSIKNHSKAGAEAMMNKLEFTPIETTYSKWIGD